MNKLLHERLREFSDGTWKCHIKNFSIEDDSYTPFVELTKNDARVLADEIERYYIPRPRFEDGEPLAKGQEFENGIVKGWCVWSDGAYEIYDQFGDVLYGTCENEPIKIPSPNVLDADGVEIKVGDTVWSMYFPNNKRIVDHITDDGQVWFEDGHWAWDIKVTHKEPDSLEKLRDEMFNAYDRDSIIGTVSIKRWADRLSALIERAN